MENTPLIILLLLVVSAVSIIAIVQFMLTRVFKRADRKYEDWRQRMDELQQENAALARDVEQFRVKLKSMSYGAVNVEIRGPDLSKDKAMLIERDVVDAIKKHIPEAYAGGPQG
jgi:hypothetical protein